MNHETREKYGSQRAETAFSCASRGRRTYHAGSRWVFLSCLACLAWFRLAAAEPTVAKEYQIKAAFLYNFTKFVEWPAEKFATPTSPIVIGVLGANPFGTELAESIKDRKVNGRELQFRHITTVAEISGLHVLFVSDGEPARWAGLETALQSGAVLGVGETEALLRAGGAIRFALEGDKVRFEIDLLSAENARLKISSQLLKLARAVRRKP